MKKGESTDDSHINTLVVEATPVCWDTDSEIPNDSVDALHGLLATGRPPSSERLVVASLSEIAHSPFYNMTVAGEPAEKPLVLLHFTQRSIGAQQSGGFRLVTDNVVDGSDLVLPQDKEQLEVGIVARCCVERCPDFTAAKASYALAVVCKAAQPAKPQHALDLYIEAMEPLSKEQISPARETLDKLRSVAAAARTDTEPSDAKAFQQREMPPFAPLPDHGSLSAMQRQSLLQSTAANAQGPCLLAFPKAAAEHYSIRSSAGAAAEHAPAESTVVEKWF